MGQGRLRMRVAARQSLRYMDRGVNSFRVRPFSVSGIHSNKCSLWIDTMKKTVLNACHRRSGARMVDFGGWEMPLHYGSQIEEHHAVRRDAGMFDVSHMCAVDVEVATPVFFSVACWPTMSSAEGPRQGTVQRHAQPSRRGDRRPDRLLPRRPQLPGGGQRRHRREGSGLDGRPPRRVAACGRHHAAPRGRRGAGDDRRPGTECSPEGVAGAARMPFQPAKR
jgi:hypothetical protein